MKNKKELKVYQNEYYNYYSDEDDYPRRIRKPVRILLFLVMLALLLLSFGLFK